jgi:ribonucleotide reductase alpha subunit
MILKARVLAGEFCIVNRPCIEFLKKRGLWNKDMREKILANRGSVQNIPEFPDDLKPLFKTVWELDMSTIIQMAADRAPFIDQSQSMNLWFPSADVSMIASAIFCGWRLGLKTLCYYLHIRAASDALAYTVNPDLLMKQIIDPDAEKYQVTSLLDEKSKILSLDVNPIHEEVSETPMVNRKRKEIEEDDEPMICTYDSSDPRKKGCFSCSS